MLTLLVFALYPNIHKLFLSFVRYFLEHQYLILLFTFRKKTMDNTTYTKSHPIKYDSFMAISTQFRSLNDNGYNSSFSYGSSYFGQLPVESTSSIATSSKTAFQLCFSTKNYAFDLDIGKLKNVTIAKDSAVSFTSSPPQKLSKKLNISSDMGIQMSHTNSHSKSDGFQVLNSQKSNLNTSFNYNHIGLEGQESVDFMCYLTELNHFVPVSEKIFSLLYGKDIFTMSMVSKTWRNAVKNSPLAKRKKSSYLKMLISVKENHGHSKQCLTRNRSRPCRRPLEDISNIMCQPFNKKRKSNIIS